MRSETKEGKSIDHALDSAGKFNGWQVRTIMAESKIFLTIELIFLFGGLPALVWYTRPQAMNWLPVLYSIPALAALWLSWQPDFKWTHLWNDADPAAERDQLRTIVYRFGAVIVVTILFMILLYPQKLFWFPRERTLVWLGIFLVYPFFSAYPQELIYRAFFFKRYQRLFPQQGMLILMSAIAFSWMHFIFRNPWAIVFTLIGGLLFAHTYARTRSLRLVCLEHALYGNCMFTIGMGEFFHHSRISPQ